MPIFYPKIEDQVNKTRFEVRIPESYEPLQTTYFQQYQLEPMFTPNSSHMCMSMLTPKHIIDMCFLDVPFEIVKDRDMLHILTIIKEYTKLAKPYSKSEEAVAFIERCDTAIYKLQQEVNRKQRIWERKYGPKGPASIVDLIKLVRGEVSYNN